MYHEIGHVVYGYYFGGKGHYSEIFADKYADRFEKDRCWHASDFVIEYENNCDRIDEIIIEQFEQNLQQNLAEIQRLHGKYGGTM